MNMKLTIRSFVYAALLSSLGCRADCTNAGQLMQKLGPVSSIIIKSGTNLSEMAQSMPPDSRDTPAAIIIGYESALAASEIAHQAVLSSLYSNVTLATNKSLVKNRLTQTADAAKKRLAVSIKSINGYVAQMNRPALITEAMAVRDSIQAYEKLLADECHQ